MKNNIESARAATMEFPNICIQKCNMTPYSGTWTSVEVNEITVAKGLEDTQIDCDSSKRIDWENKDQMLIPNAIKIRGKRKRGDSTNKDFMKKYYILLFLKEAFINGKNMIALNITQAVFAATDAENPSR